MKRYALLFVFAVIVALTVGCGSMYFENQKLQEQVSMVFPDKALTFVMYTDKIPSDEELQTEIDKLLLKGGHSAYALVEVKRANECVYSRTYLYDKILSKWYNTPDKTSEQYIRNLFKDAKPSLVRKGEEYIITETEEK